MNGLELFISDMETQSLTVKVWTDVLLEPEMFDDVNDAV